MDPFTILGLTASIFQFIELGVNIYGTAKEIRDSSSNMTEDDRRTSDVIKDMRRLYDSLKQQVDEPQTEDEQALCRLAEACRKLAEKIIAILEKTASPDLKSFWRTSVAVIRSHRYRKEKEELLVKLQYCQSQLQAQSFQNFIGNTKINLAELARNSEINSDQLNALQENVQKLHNGVRVESLSKGTEHQLRSLFAVSHIVREAIAQKLILKNLAFHDIHNRFDVVDFAHGDTYRWLLEENIEGGDSDMVQAHHKFVNWLLGEQRIFHIAGKLGSGKSTLMKFLFNHPHTRMKLEKWASTCRIVQLLLLLTSNEGKTYFLAGYFFWKPGSTLQNSFDGLQRSLLHNSLQQCPELIPVVFPNQWQRTISQVPLHPHLQEDQKFQREDVSKGFDILISDRMVHDQYRICFFIDALDEHKETSHVDNLDMIQHFHNWTSGRNTVKLCVSSREDNVFLSELSNESRIRLQDLTRKDMREYVSNKLSIVQPPGIHHSMVRAIVDRSEGIFLWTVLVVKDFRQCLNDGEYLRDFTQRLARLPSEMEGLLEHLLSSLDSSSRKKAYRLFSIVSPITRCGMAELPATMCLFIDCLETNGNFAVEWSDQELNAVASRQATQIHPDSDLGERARKRIQGICKGLLEVRTSPKYGTDCVVYTHRSVWDFIKRQQDYKEVSDTRLDFVNSLSQLYLASLRSASHGSIPQNLWRHLIYFLIFMQSQNGFDTDTSRFLKLFEDKLHTRYDLCFERLPKQHTICNVSNEDTVTIKLCPLMESDGTYPFSDIIRCETGSPFLISAYRGEMGPVEYILSKNPNILDDITRRGAFLACLVWGQHKRWVKYNRRILERIELTLGKEFPPYGEGIWPYLIFQYATFPDCPDPTGIDILLAMILKKYRDQDLLRLTVIYDSGPLPSWPLLITVSGGQIEWREFMLRVDPCQPKRTRLQYILSQEQGREITFRELVECHKPETQTELLQLMDEIEGKQPSIPSPDSPGPFKPALLKALPAPEQDPTETGTPVANLPAHSDSGVESSDTHAQDPSKPLGKWHPVANLRIPWLAILVALFGIVLALVIARFLDLLVVVGRQAA